MKFQITCPKCKHEFRYDRDYYNRIISDLGAEIGDINRQLAEYKTWTIAKQKERAGWRRSVSARLEKKKAEIRELKTYRSQFEAQVNEQKEKVFRGLVKELLGADEYIRLREEAEKTCEAYRISDLMKTEYTRKGGKSIISQNKM